MPEMLLGDVDGCPRLHEVARDRVPEAVGGLLPLDPGPVVDGAQALMNARRPGFPL